MPGTERTQSVAARMAVLSRAIRRASGGTLDAWDAAELRLSMARSAYEGSRELLKEPGMQKESDIQLRIAIVQLRVAKELFDAFAKANERSPDITVKVNDGERTVPGADFRSDDIEGMLETIKIGGRIDDSVWQKYGIAALPAEDTEADANPASGTMDGRWVRSDSGSFFGRIMRGKQAGTT